LEALPLDLSAKKDFQQLAELLEEKIFYIMVHRMGYAHSAAGVCAFSRTCRFRRLAAHR
jgi:hypothetical protein